MNEKLERGLNIFEPKDDPLEDILFDAYST